MFAELNARAIDVMKLLEVGMDAEFAALEASEAGNALIVAFMDHRQVPGRTRKRRHDFRRSVFKCIRSEGTGSSALSLVGQGFFSEGY